MTMASRAVFSNKRIQQTGVGSSNWIILDKGGAGVASVQVEASASATVSIQCTLSLSLINAGDTVPAAEINDIQDMTDLVANGAFTIQGPIKAVRINQTAGVGTSTITVLQAEGN